ncbi:MAG: hypothetical protein NC416_13390 [Eubacterium sp.]|nr:hypothetical protein [Eubacterium sp.]
MKTLRKCIAFVLAAGLMLSAMTVFASDCGDPDYKTGTNIAILDNGVTCYTGDIQPNSANSEIAPKNGDVWVNITYKNRSVYISDSSGCGGNWILNYGDEEAEEGTPVQAEPAAEAVAEAAAAQSAVADEGFENAVDMYNAAEKGMSAGEYYNNVVTSTPGIQNAITVGQGGNLVVNGKVTNMVATISKVTNRAYVDSVRIEQEGTVLNVVDVQYPAVEATINFYTPGVVGDMEIAALQYKAGTWVDVEVAEVRADHVVLNMKGSGVVAFIAK